MICIAADTTSSKLILALLKDGEIFCHTQEVGKSGHSSLLMPAIKRLMDANGVSPDMLDTVAVNVGPGSFTGIRIGVSAVTALAFAVGAKRIAVTSFDLIAYDSGQVLAAVDAGHGNVYAAVCKDGKTLSTAFYEGDEAKELQNAVFEPLGDPATTLAKVVLEKAARGDYCSVFEPLYLRKSQAEREMNDF